MKHSQVYPVVLFGHFLSGQSRVTHEPFSAVDVKIVGVEHTVVAELVVGGDTIAHAELEIVKPCQVSQKTLA